jgi:hypothetical protein
LGFAPSVLKPYSGLPGPSNEFLSRFYPSYSTRRGWGTGFIKNIGPARKYDYKWTRPRQLKRGELLDAAVAERYFNNTGRWPRGGSMPTDTADYLRRTGQPQLPPKLPKSRKK